MLDLLRSRFTAARSGDLDATIEFNWHADACRVSILNGEPIYHENANSAPEPDFIIYFRDEAQAKAIVLGQADPVAAFMDGDFRSSGHLVWVFQTLAAFSGS